MNLATAIATAKACGNNGFWYVATPYSKYPAGQEWSFRDSSAVAATLLSAGVPVFCPIAHSHPLAIYGEMDKLDHTVWLPLDEHMMKAAAGIIVVCMEGWSDSYGVNHEIAFFRRYGKPVIYLELDGLELPSDNCTQWTPEEISKAVHADVGLKQATEGYTDTPMSSEERKQYPIATGVFDYFPDALMGVAKISKLGNDKHNPGQPLHHARGKSTDHADAMLRHFKDRGEVDAAIGADHSAEMCWRALALYQQELEDRGVAKLARGAIPPTQTPLRSGVDKGSPDGDFTSCIVVTRPRQQGKRAQSDKAHFDTDHAMNRYLAMKKRVAEADGADRKAAAHVEGRRGTDAPLYPYV